MCHRAPFCCTFWRVGSKVSFSLLFVCFSRGSDPRSARAGAVETQFFILGVASKRVSFLQKLLEHSWYTWRRNPLTKKHLKIELENRSCKGVLVLLPGFIFASFWILYGVSFVPLGREFPQRGKVFASLGALDSQKVVSRLVWGHISRFLESVGRLGPFKKTTISHACPWLWAAGQPKKGPSSLTLNLDQQPDKLKSTEKQKTDHLHWVTHRGGLGAAH